MTIVAAACGSSKPPESPGSAAGESITGRERMGWDQQARDAGELSSFHFALYVDGTRTEFADASCSTNAGSAGFPCSGKLPAIPSGAHTLELAAFTIVDGRVNESSRSAPLRVVVTASLAATVEWPTGEIETTRDALTLRIDKLADGLDRPADAAFVPDGRLFIADGAGRVRLVVDGALQQADALALTENGEEAVQRALSIAPDPDFPRTHLLFVAHTAESADSPVVRVSRYREVGGKLAERAFVFETKVPSAATAAAVARFGPDGKLYLAANGDEGNGRLFRLNPDGTMPRDQAGTTPAIAGGLAYPRGLGWDSRSAILWIADDDDGTAGDVSGLSISGAPVHAMIRGRHMLRGRIGSLAFYGSDVMPPMRNDALLASAAGYVLRLRFADDEPTRVERSEWLLQNRVGPVRVVAVGPDGAIYFCTDTALGRLTPVR